VLARNDEPATAGGDRQGGRKNVGNGNAASSKPHPQSLQGAGDNRNSAGPSSRPTKPVLSPTGGLPAPAVGEENDNYPHVVARLHEGWRVIVCKGAIQWVLQRRHAAPNSWRGSAFCCTREALLRNVRERAGEIGGDALVILLRLPERI
jgi:hypothetical protein